MLRRLCAIIIIVLATLCLSVAVYAEQLAERFDTEANVRGQQVIYTLYNIDDYRCIRVCDLAELLKDTPCRFNVTYLEEDGSSLKLTKGRAYKQRDGVDTLIKGDKQYVKYTQVPVSITVGDVTTELEGYLINKNYYLRVRDLAQSLAYVASWRDFGSFLELADYNGNVLAMLCLIPFGDFWENTVTASTSNDDTIVQDDTVQTTVTANVETTTEATTADRVVDKDKPMIALTFDDGPRYDSTEHIIEALEKVGGRATFFVVGDQVIKNPDIVKQAVEAGCQIGNHSNTHTNLNKLSEYGIKTEVNTCSNRVYEAAGVYPMIGRPPYGSVDDNVRAAVSIPWFNWNVDTLDWKYQDEDYVYNTVVNNAKDGQVVLMHDLHKTTSAAMVRAIPKLVEMGYQLVTIDEMAEAKGGYENVPGYIKK